MQVLCGLFPIAQVREPFSAIRYLAERLPLEKIYGLTLPDPDEPQWSAHSICEAYAIKRGYFLKRSGRPDVHRAGLEILNDCCDGKLSISWPPPDFEKLIQYSKKQIEEDAKLIEGVKHVATKQKPTKQKEQMKLTRVKQLEKISREETKEEPIPPTKKKPIENTFTVLEMLDDDQN